MHHLPLTEAHVIDAYMDLCSSEGHRPQQLAALATHLGQREATLRALFPSLAALEAQIFATFLEHTLALLNKSPEYADYAASEKLLGLYYTFFELLTANRAYVQVVLPPDLRAIPQIPRLERLHRGFVAHLNTLVQDLPSRLPPLPGQAPLLAEGFWLQFLSILAFWQHDTSPAFEQTDVFIEKSVAASLESLQLQPGAQLLDWGKFWGQSILGGFKR
jgi:hypothetical protein